MEKMIARATSEMVRRYEAGETLAAVALTVGCAHQTVARYLRKSGVTIRRRGKPHGFQYRPAQTAAVLAGRDAGLTYAEIGKKFGMTRQGAHNICRRASERSAP